MSAVNPSWRYAFKSALWLISSSTTLVFPLLAAKMSAD